MNIRFNRDHCWNMFSFLGMRMVRMIGDADPVMILSGPLKAVMSFAPGWRRL